MSISGGTKRKIKRNTKIRLKLRNFQRTCNKTKMYNIHVHEHTNAINIKVPSNSSSITKTQPDSHIFFDKPKQLKVNYRLI